MSKSYSSVLVIDIESTCWPEKKSKDSQNLETIVIPPSEIIEIGMAMLDLQTLSIQRCPSLFIKPILGWVSPFCTELTEITAEQLERAMKFAEALEILIKHNKSKKHLFASYGNYDRQQFERQLAYPSYVGLKYPFGSSHLNIKNLWAVLSGTKEVGMEKALEKLGMTFEGRPHTGQADALNAARILKYIIQRFRMWMPLPQQNILPQC